LRPLIDVFWAQVSARVERKHRAGRLKQWLNFMRRVYPEAEVAYAALRTINDPTVIDAYLLQRAEPRETERTQALAMADEAL
jgi:tRNA-dihydrouridine synthase C